MTDDSNVSRADVEAAPPKKRSVAKLILWAFLGFAAVVVAALAGAVVYLQSGDAFRRIILPIADGAYPGAITADSGRVSLSGRVEVAGLRVTDAAGADFVSARSALLEVDLRSFMAARDGVSIPIVRRAEADGVSVVLRTGGAPDDVAPAEEPAEDSADGPKAPPAAYLPVSILSASLTDANVAILDGERVQARVEGIDAKATNLTRGSPAEISLGAKFVVAPDEPANRRAGSLSVDLSVVQDAAGTSLSWSGETKASVDEGPEASEPISLAADLTGDLSGFAKAKVGLDSSTRVGERPGGRLVLAVDWDRDAGTLDASLDLKEIRRDLPNVALAIAGPTRIESGMIDGSIRLTGTGDTYRAESSLSVANASVRTGPDDKPTPSVDLPLTIRGEYDRAGGVATIEALEASLVEAGETLGSAKLDRAVSLKVGDAGAQGEASDALPESAELSVDLKRLGVANARAWLAVFGSDALADVREGDLSGKLVVGIGDRGERLAAKGDLKLAKLVLARGEDETIGPMTIEQRIDGSAERLRAFELAPSRVSVALDGSTLAADLTAKADLDASSFELVADFGAGDLSRMLDRLGALPDDASIAPSGGGAKGKVSVRRTAKDAPIAIEGATTLDGLSLASEGRSVVRSFAAEFALRLDPAFEVATVERGTVRLRDANKREAGEISLAGTWPIKQPDAASGRPGHAGKADVSVAGLDLKPWIDLLDAPRASEIASAPLGAKLTVAATAPGENAALAISGTTTLDGLSVASEGRSLVRSLAADFAVRLESNFEFATIERSRIRLADAKNADAGSIGATGFWPLKRPDPESGRPGRAGKADVTIEGLELKPWLDFFDAPAAKDIASAPLRATLAVEVDATGDVFRFRGEERIGPVLLTADGKQESIEVSLTNEIRKVRDRVEEFVVDATAKRPGAPDDRLKATGNATLGERTAVQVAVRSENFDAGYYADRFGGGSGAESSERSAGAGSGKSKGGAPAKSNSDAGAPPPKPAGGAAAARNAFSDTAATAQSEARPEPARAETRSPSEAKSKSAAKPGEPREVPLDLAATFDFARIQYRDLTVEGVKGQVASDRETIAARVDSALVAGGSITGHLDAFPNAATPNFTWRMDGERLDSARLVAALAPDMAGKIEGQAKFSTEGLGYLDSERMKDSMEGVFVFDLADGKLKNSELLEFIAQSTRISEFEQIVFKDFHGDIEVAQGWANLNDVWVRGIATRLAAKGRVSLDGEFDYRVQPSVGQSLSNKLPGEFTRFGNLVLNDGYLDVPLSITVKGDTKKPRYGATIELPTAVDAAKNLVKDLVGGEKKATPAPDGSTPAPGPTPTDPVSRLTEDPAGALGDAVGGVVDGLIGGIGRKKK